MISWIRGRENVKDRLVRLRKMFMTWKVYIGRTSSYMAIMNLALVLKIYLGQRMSIFILAPLTLLVLIVVGWADVHVLKTYKVENQTLHELATLHPIYHEMNDRLKRIEEKVDGTI
jgi:hypothetical protein